MKMDKAYRTAAVVLAAGSGKRMNAGVKKQYMEIAGKPVLYYSLKAFEESFIDEIVLVVSQDEIEQVKKDYVNQYGFRKVSQVVAGGKERYYSVACGLRAVHPDCDFVFIHDSARPMLTQEILQRVYWEVQKEEACVVGVPSKDTVKIADEQGYVSVTPNRSLVWNVQTPQVFSYPLVRNAYEELLQKEQELSAAGVQITDDAMVVEHLAHHKIKLVEGSYENIKITTPEDVQIAERYLQSRQPDSWDIAGSIDVERI